MAWRRAARSPALWRPFGSSFGVPSEKTVRSVAATTKTLNRDPRPVRAMGPPKWTVRPLRRGRELIGGADRGMLSCSPAQAARRTECRPGGSRSSSAPTRRRNARICGRVRSSRVLPTHPRLLAHQPWAGSDLPILRLARHNRRGHRSSSVSSSRARCWTLASWRATEPGGTVMLEAPIACRVYAHRVRRFRSHRQHARQAGR